MLKYLVDKKVLSKVNHGHLFLLGLLKQVREKVVGKYNLDNIKPETYSYYN